jgi:hypothetical protein
VPTSDLQIALTLTWAQRCALLPSLRLLSSHPARIAIMRRMTRDNLRDYVIVAVGLFAVGVIGTFRHVWPYRPIDRVIFGLSVVAFLMAVWFVASWLGAPSLPPV